MKTIKNCSLYYKEGNSDKEYHIQLTQDGSMCFVNFQYGRVGNALQNGTKTPTAVSLAEAEKVYDKLYREKTGKGYIDNGSKKNDFTEVVNSPQKKEVILLPQLLNAIDDISMVEQLIEDDSYLAQEKKDGERRMVISAEQVIGLNKKGTEVPLPDSIARAIRGLGCTLDGELVGSTLFAFDLLSKNGQDLRNSSCIERYELLRLLSIIKPGTDIVVVETAYTAKEKRHLFERLKAENREGIVFKKKVAPYTVGRPSSGGNQFKFKFQKTATFIVANLTKGKRSIGIELMSGKEKVFMGKCTIPPNHELPEVGDLVEVQYLYAYKGGAVYQPVYKGKRNDSDLSDATLSQIIYKSENDIF